MKRSALMLTGLLLLLAGSGRAGPIKGSYARSENVQAGSPGVLEFKETFKGGRRACVIVRGDHKPVVNLGLQVFDADGKLVARDDGEGDISAVVWYPPRDATYTIKLLNPNADYNKCYISIK